MRITVHCWTCSSQSSMHLCHFSAKLFMPVKWNLYVMFFSPLLFYWLSLLYVYDMVQCNKPAWLIDWLSFQPGIHRRLHFMIVWIADTTKKIFQILKQIIVTVHQVTSVCRVILLYEAGVMSSLLGDCRLVGWTAGSDLWEFWRAC